MKKTLLDPKDNLIIGFILAVLFMTILTSVFGIDGIWRFIGGAAVFIAFRQITKRIKAKEETDAEEDT